MLFYHSLIIDTILFLLESNWKKPSEEGDVGSKPRFQVCHSQEQAVQWVMPPCQVYHLRQDCDLVITVTFHADCRMQSLVSIGSLPWSGQIWSLLQLCFPWEDFPDSFSEMDRHLIIFLFPLWCFITLKRRALYSNGL